MTTTIQISLLNLSFVATQAFYMYLSCKNLMKTKLRMYYLAMPVVLIYAVALFKHDPAIYSLYEYAVIICIILVAIADVSYSTVMNRDYITDTKTYMLTITYIMICTAIAWLGNTGVIIRMSTTGTLIGIAVFCICLKKCKLSELLKAAAFAGLSVICSWTFLNYLL